MKVRKQLRTLAGFMSLSNFKKALEADKLTAYREFWIDSESYAHDSDVMRQPGMENWTRNDSLTHVIEKSAYDQLQAELKRCQEIAERDGKDYSDLKAQLAKYKAALESIAHTRCAWQLSQEIAKAALAEGEPTPDEPQCPRCHSPYAINSLCQKCIEEENGHGL